MPRELKIGIAVGGILVVVPALAALLLFFGISALESSPIARRNIGLTNQGNLVISGEVRGRSEHGTSQRAGYQPPGSQEIEWFGDVSDGVEPQVYFSRSLVVVIDAPSACLFVRNPGNPAKWKTMALIFPNDLGPFPISYYAKSNGLSVEEVLRINDLGGKREKKWPTTYIENFDSDSRELKCSYHVDNQSSWPLQLRLSEDGTHLALVAVGAKSP